MGRGGNSRKNNWPLILQAVGLAFTILTVIVGGLVTWAYLNGGTQHAIEDHGRRIEALERGAHDRPSGPR